MSKKIVFSHSLNFSNVLVTNDYLFSINTFWFDNSFEVRRLVITRGINLGDLSLANPNSIQQKKDKITQKQASVDV